jgi:hypothetical protein
MVGLMSSALTVETSPSINPARMHRMQKRTVGRKSFMNKKKEDLKKDPLRK